MKIKENEDKSVPNKIILKKFNKTNKQRQK